MKKQIAYIEIDTHAEIAENFAELTKNSEKFSVDFYFSKKSRINFQWRLSVIILIL